jgi:phytoene dehydrogenase-like protein
MIEDPGKSIEKRWKCKLGKDVFQKGPLTEFGGDVEEFEALREITKELVVGQAIPAMAMRPGSAALIPLLRYFPTLVELLKQGPELTGTFAPYMDGPKFVVKNPWLRNWLDALAFSLSGLPASRTAAAAMAFVLDDMHRDGAALDYPKGGLGKVIDALVRGLEQGDNGSKLHLRNHVESIDFSEDTSRATGLTLRNGKRVYAKEGVICNAPVWSLNDLLKDDDKAKDKLNNYLNLKQQQQQQQQQHEPRQTWKSTSEGSIINKSRPPIDDSRESLLYNCDTAEMTGSFLHLHIAIDATDLDLDQMEAHYTVMDRGLGGDGTTVSGVQDGPCGELNMIAVSNPCVIDKTLAPEGYMILHAYGAGNEPYHVWQGMKGSSPEYQALKEERSGVLWRAIESIIPDVRERAVMDLVGSPLTHERFLRRPRGTYGAATEDYFKDGSTPISNFVMAGDSIFPGIGKYSIYMRLLLVLTEHRSGSFSSMFIHVWHLRIFITFVYCRSSSSSHFWRQRRQCLYQPDSALEVSRFFRFVTIVLMNVQLYICILLFLFVLQVITFVVILLIIVIFLIIIDIFLLLLLFFCHLNASPCHKGSNR